MREPAPPAEGITYMECGPDIALLGNKMTGSTLYYSFTVVTEGSIEVLLSDANVALKKNDLFIYPPGIQFRTRNVSDDYMAVSIVADELFTQDIPQIRRAIGASYIPLLTSKGKCTHLSEVEVSAIQSRMEGIRRYIQSDSGYRQECLQFEYALLVMDILDLQSRKSEILPTFSDCNRSILVEFFRLLQIHVNAHHDIPFYANELNITPIYLSRVIKKTTGRTVMHFVNQMLGIEASNLLLHTDMAISEIASSVGFADSASFCKFFVRQMQMSPRQYRKSKLASSEPSAEPSASC